ncbi:MAG: hypothetical protein HQL99_15990 [Magnetococcales bacterium]|nr:hypothetical protein [Magnetococcales bacterium]
MITLERWLHASARWIGETWNRLAAQTGDATSGRRDTPTEPEPSRWSLRAFRVSLSRRGETLARLMGQRVTPERNPATDGEIVYEKQGKLKRLEVSHRSTGWSTPPDRKGQWTTPAFRVELSPPGRVAGGALASVHAAPGELDRFVERIRDERRAGLYPPRVFQQARELLKHSADTETMGGMISGAARSPGR